MILDPGFNLTLRPMKYPQFFAMYQAAIKNTWSVQEIGFAEDINHLKKMTPAERHMIQRLVAFFATGDTIVGNNAAISLYQNINSPEARLYLSRQLFEEAQHVEFYLQLLDTYLPNPDERAAAFNAVETIPSIKLKAAFAQKWMDLPTGWDAPAENKLVNLLAFGLAIEGIFFFSAFAYVYFLRSRGLLPGLAAGTNWVFRDESGHLGFCLEVADVVRREAPETYGRAISHVPQMIADAAVAEKQFADDTLQYGVAGLSRTDMHQYIEYVADMRLKQVGLDPQFGAKNPLTFMDAQDVQELGNFFERRVTAYQTGVVGDVDLNHTDF